jgi:hypothetical protein
MVTKGNKYGFYDSYGNQNLPISFEKITVQGSHGFVVENDNQKGLYSNYGRKITDIEFDVIHPFGDHDFPSMALVEKGGRYGYISMYPDIVIPAKYDSPESILQDYKVSEMERKIKSRPDEFGNRNTKRSRSLDLGFIKITIDSNR